MKLLFKALTAVLVGAVAIGSFIFLPAGTLNFLQGWLFMGVLFVPMIILGTVLLFKSPKLLEKRLNAKEKQKGQKGVIGLSALMFLGGFILAGLDFRFSWSKMPLWVSAIASVVFLLAYGLYCEVMRENEYLSRTIEVSQGQTVVDSGLYGIVRHPMYSVTLFLFFAIPLILGSWWALLVFLIYPVLIIYRLLGEEQFLEKELEGYIEYEKKVKYRLIPYIW
jgi:protein-S-isoprenylcysteine O-methyltransferase Ste14